MQPLRSFLFTPADHARRVEKVFSVGADAAILDLEDAVAIARKPAARALAVAALQRPRGDCLGYVRVNAMETEFCFGDLHGIVHPGLDGIVLPKVETAAGLLAVDWAVGNLERERGLPAGGIDIMPIIETAKGLANIDAIARCGSRIKRVSCGAGDFTLDLNMVWSRTETELLHARAT
ncbi:MAG: CoA ester lyase, partial [Alphaproteobacteria bacterium]